MIKELRLNLRPLIKKLEVGLKKGTTGEFLPSSYKSVFKGRGLEFEGYRAYFPGVDDAGTIDWKASLRAKELQVRLLTEERNLHGFFLFDVGNSMLFASTEKLKCEYAAEVIAAISFAMLSSGDRVGLCMFTDKTVKTIPSALGRRHFYSIVRALGDPNFYGGGFDFINIAKFMLGYLPEGTVLFIVSDFIGIPDEGKTLLKMLGVRFDVIGIMIRDPRDDEIPREAGQFVVSDPYSDAELLIDTSLVEEEYKKYVSEKLKEMKETFVLANADLLILRTDEPFLHALENFFRMRRARWR